MAEIGVLVKTCGREEPLLTCLGSLRDRLREQEIAHRVYVADDGPISSAKRAAYDRLREEGHVVRVFDEPVGVGRARNLLADELEEERWVLRMDDDFQLTGETDVAAMRRILEEVPGLGLVADVERQIGHGKGVFSGQISDAQGRFERRGTTLVKRLRPVDAFAWERAGPYRFARCDFTRNFLLVRRELLEEVRWDDRLLFAGEHADFLLQVEASRWDAGFTPDSVHLHRDDLGDGRPSLAWDARGRATADRVFREKWGIERITVRRPWTATLRAALVKARQTARDLASVVR